MSAVATTSSDELFGHPKGLFFLFFTEMWERFSYYGMRSLLVYYMIKHLLFAQEEASRIYGLYTGFVYFTPFFGGILADRFLGQRKTVILGGVTMAIGHFLMAFESMFFPALVCLVIGNGAFKPNISTQVGTLYKEDDPRRDKAFSIFYVGINLGAFLSPLICGTLGEVYGWHYGFGAAGIGMLVGLVVYLMGQKHLASDLIMTKKASAEVKKDEPMTREDKHKIGALFILCLLNVVFWAAYEQQGNTLALWVDTYTDRHIFGWEMPATWYQAFNPLMIILFTPAIIGFWSWQNKRKKEPGSVTKMAIGCLLLGTSFLVLIPAAKLSEHGPVGLWWITLCTFIFTLGELYLSPIGLSLVTKVAPARMVSMIMGMWFLSSFAGNYLSGHIGTFWEKMSKGDFFLLLALLSICAGALMVVLIKPMRKVIGRI